MQDILDNTGAGYEYDYIWLYTCYPILVQWKNTTKVYNNGVTAGVQGWEPPHWQANCKIWAPTLLLFRYSVLFSFSVSCFFAFFGSFEPFFSRWFRILAHRNPHPDTFSLLNFFLNVGVGPPTAASGPLSATFPTLAKTSSYATGLQINLHK